MGLTLGMAALSTGGGGLFPVGCSIHCPKSADDRLGPRNSAMPSCVIQYGFRECAGGEG
jgi:hypothetical protein